MSDDYQVHVEAGWNPEPLPADWSSYTSLQKMAWFLKYYGDYAKDGEIGGIQSFVPDEIKAAYEAFRKEPDCPMHSVYDRK